MGSKYLYQWEYARDEQPPEKKLSDWQPHSGVRVLERSQPGVALKVEVRVLVDHPNVAVALVGDFNEWKPREEDHFTLDEHGLYASLVTDKLKHKDPYKLHVQYPGQQAIMLQDPAGVYFDDNGNNIFWDFGDPTAYKQQYPFVRATGRAHKIVQTDLPGLIVHWANKDGVCGRDIPTQEYYKFVADSGVLDEIKDLGFTAIQFLPFAQSIDGDNWKFRYLVPFQYAIYKNWGTPDEFARMIDACHERGIAVIGDFVISHLPDRDYHVFGFHCDENGLHKWVNRRGEPLYLGEETNWGSRRWAYNNPHVLRFVIDSCIHFQKAYRIDGYRIDNVDGIVRYGPHGHGDERPYGRGVLRNLTRELYSYNPDALIHLEAHYFPDDNAKMLVVPYEDNQRAIAATAYNSSRTTYFFHRWYMIFDVEKCDLWKLRNYIDEKEGGQSNSTIADFHNHDAAAGLMHQRATGSYAYDAMTQSPGNHHHAVGKIKVMEAYISFFMEGRTLDLIQTFLLQSGTFEHDSSIQWFLSFNESNRAVLRYKKEINDIMNDPAFWPENTKHRRILNCDDKNKILVVERASDTSRYVIIINFSAWVHNHYKIGLSTENDYKVMLNGESFRYAGQGTISYPQTLKNNPSTAFELLNREVELGVLAPYGVVVLKEVRDED